MPLRNGRLTPREHKFVEVMVRTGDADYSATKAGYAGSNRGAALMAKPAIAQTFAEKFAAARERLLGEAFPKAVEAVIDNLEHGTRREKQQASDSIFKAVNTLGKADDLDAKEVHEMTRAEQLAYFEQNKHLLVEGQAVRLGLVEPAPTVLDEFG